MFVSSQTVDNLALLDVAAVNAALSGAFDSRIKELRSLLDQVAAQDAKVKTLADAEKLKAEAEASAKAAKAVEAAASEAFGDLAKREEVVKAAKAALEAERRRLLRKALRLRLKRQNLQKTGSRRTKASRQRMPTLTLKRRKLSRLD